MNTFKRGDIVFFCPRVKGYSKGNIYSAKKGAQARVVESNDNNNFVQVEWIDRWKHGNHKQADGGYYYEDFVLANRTNTKPELYNYKWTGAKPLMLLGEVTCPCPLPSVP